MGCNVIKGRDGYVGPGPILAILSALMMGITSGCVTLGSYGNAREAWHSGAHQRAVKLARAEYERFLAANQLNRAAVETLTRRIMATFDHDLILLPQEQSSMPRFDPAAITPRSLKDEVRADLLSGRITAVLRGTANAIALGPKAHGPGLLAVIYRRAPIAADGGVMPKASAALRSLVTKRAALTALEQVASKR